MFVAAFIGSPPMNLFAAHTDGSALRVGELKLPMTGKAAEIVAGLEDGSSVTFGFRPEHLELGEAAPADALRIPANAEVVEFLGDEELIHARAAGGEMLAASAPTIASSPVTGSSSGWLCPRSTSSTPRPSWPCCTDGAHVGP